MRRQQSLMKQLWTHCFSIGLFSDPHPDDPMVKDSLSRLVECTRGCLPLGAISVLRQKFL